MTHIFIHRSQLPHFSNWQEAEAYGFTSYKVRIIGLENPDPKLFHTHPFFLLSWQIL